jgi:hypothetical protein
MGLTFVQIQDVFSAWAAARAVGDDETAKGFEEYLKLWNTGYLDGSKLVKTCPSGFWKEPLPPLWPIP